MEGHKKQYQPDTPGPFKCARCSADAFPTKPEYKKHYFQSHFQHLQPSEVATSVGGSSHTCTLCFATLKSKGSLLIHMNTCHVIGGNYRCDLCCCCYNTRLGFQKHYKRYHGKLSVSIPSLIKKNNFGKKAGSDSESNRKLATSRLRAVSAVNCEIGIPKTAGAHSYNSPSRAVNNRNFKTGEPPLRTWTSKAYPYSCDVCQVFFSSTSNRNTHMKSSHVPLDRGGKFKCSLCPCVFSSEMSRKTHHSFRHVANRKDRKVKSVAVRITSRITSSRRTKISLSNKVATRKAAINNAKLGSKLPETVAKETKPTETPTVPKPLDELCCEYCNAEFLCQADVITHIFKMHKSKVERVNMNEFDLKNLLSGPFRIAFPSSFHPTKM